MPRRRKSSPVPVEEFVDPAADEPVADEAADTDAGEATGPTLLAPLDDLGGELRRAADLIESMRAEVEGRIAGLIEDLEVSHARALEEEARRRAEIEERLDDLREERKSFEERVIAAEKAAEDVRAAMKSLEEETRKERDRLASERSAMHARVLQSEQERDEALVLVATLTRRLKTPGIDRALNGEEKPVEEKEPEKEEE